MPERCMESVVRIGRRSVCVDGAPPIRPYSWSHNRCDLKLTGRRAGERTTAKRAGDESVQLQGRRDGHGELGLRAEVRQPLSCLLPYTRMNRHDRLLC
jgi:hypothetical protein